MHKIGATAAVIFFVILLCPLQAFAQSPENLDEMFTRKDRRFNATFPVNLLENASNGYIWQPETLAYQDVQTGHEVWKMSNTPNLMTYYHNDIGISPWSADGKRVAFWAWKRNTTAFTGEENSYMWMLVDATGKNLRPIINGPSRIATGYFHWSPQIPDTYYDYGLYTYRPWAERSLFDSTKIYRATVSDTTVTSSPILSFNYSSPNIGKYISPDGRKIITEQWFNDTSPLFLYPATIYPESHAGVSLPNGYSQYRNFGPYGGTIASATRYHDAYYSGDGSWYFAMPNVGATWWRIKTLGSAADGGALYTGDDGNKNFGEIWPENHGTLTAGDINSPFVQVNPYTPNKTSYWSHFVPDMWGRYALFSNVADGLPGTGSYLNRIGPGVWDIQNHVYSEPSLGGGAQHHDWHGFTDWIVSSGSLTSNYYDQVIYGGKYNDSNSRITVSSAHTRYNNGTAYNSLVRPGQSPDGTKVAWQSEFMNPGADKTDIFWSVVYYPYPPTNLAADYDNGVAVRFLPPKYTERGWPFANETLNSLRNGSWPELDGKGREIGEPLYAREIRIYRVWRAASQSGADRWQEIGTVDALYNYTYNSAEDPNNELMMLHPVDASGFRISPTNKIYFKDNAGDGTFYYAITSEEYSGLESDELSEILQVTRVGTSISSQVVASKGIKNFWTTSPAEPGNFNYSLIAVGQYRLSWAEPADSKLRYYNIYYSTSGNPSAIQQQRIASVPAGTSGYLDWLADPAVQGYYGITSVDRYGNEGEVVYPGSMPSSYAMRFKISLERASLHSGNGRITISSQASNISANITANSTGDFILNGVNVTGPFDVKLAVDGFLARVVKNVSISFIMQIEFPQLLAGDIDGNNQVDAADFSLMRDKWRQSDAVADFNRDGFVNALDFSLMNKNWQKTGD
jgi:hypothetical protein